MSSERKKWRLGNHKALSDFFEFASERIKRKPMTIQIVPEKRTVDQNSMFWHVYTQIAHQREDMSVKNVRNYCKLHFGVPILRAGDAEFREFYDISILRNLTYEQKIEAMEIVPVTSRMNTEQGSQYIREMLQHWSEQGVYVQMKEDEFYAEIS